jgi:hypothetical protein
MRFLVFVASEFEGKPPRFPAKKTKLFSSTCSVETGCIERRSSLAYILERAVTRADADPVPLPDPSAKGRYTVGLGGFRETLICDIAISSADYLLPEPRMARGM